MNHETALGVACHMIIIIGLSALVVAIAISQGKEFKEEYRAWKGDKMK
jgi:hypothetical protein